MTSVSSVIILCTALCVCFHTCRPVLCVYYEYVKTFVTQVSKCADVLSCLPHEEVTEWRSAKAETPVKCVHMINSLYGDAGFSGAFERKYSAGIRTPRSRKPFVTERRFTGQRFPRIARIKQAVSKISWTRAPEFPYFSSRLLRMYRLFLFKKKTVSLPTLQCFMLYLCDPRTISCKKGTFICHFLHRNYQSYTQDSKLSVLETKSVG